MHSFAQVLKENINIDEIDNDIEQYIDKISELIQTHFNFLFSENYYSRIFEASEEGQQRLEKAIKNFFEDYRKLQNLRDSEIQRVLEVKNNIGIIDPEKANNNVKRINNCIENLQISGDEVGKAMNRVYTDTNEHIKLINELHKTLPKKPNIAIRMINLLKSKFKV
jgi:flagellar motility protein MotE (MotC chaperone)